ncbi:MAG: hypothetical protein HOE82_08545 [Gammaproteobacteria bacterium]|jgi:hypothetical protein|nr:hypothetical protein [Gammaproteobacteria bacterium]
MEDADMQLLDSAKLGIEADSFKSSALYRYLRARSMAECDDALDALISADPGDVQANTKLRNDIRVAEGCLAWIDEAVAAGAIAVDQLREQETED